MCKLASKWLAVLAWSVGIAAAQSGVVAGPVVQNLEVASEDARVVRLHLSWPNSWRHQRNHDAAWLVLRGPDARAGVLELAGDGHTATAAQGPEMSLQVSEDRVGMLVVPAAGHRGNVHVNLSIRLAAKAPEAVTAWSVGMVYIPATGFELGDDAALPLAFGAFHRLEKSADGTLTPTPYPVRDESEIQVAEEAGALWYATDKNLYRGDRGGPIPAAWPKGTRAFYVMKHELRQGAYAAFLSALPRAWQDARAPVSLQGQESATCTIVREGERFVAGSPERPCNFVSWDDTCAWMDWVGLRPMTELEFEKAARGPSRPVAGDYPWGVAEDSAMKRTVLENRDLANSTVADERSLSDDTLAQHGASFYWVMDLSGSVWERVVSAGHEVGRKFVGSHGDGALNPDGMADNVDWPKTVGRDAPGVGFRGGAEYFKPKKASDPTNPHSPVAVRTYAGWGGAQRYKTYSARGVRTAPVAREKIGAKAAKELAADLRARVARDQEVRSKFGLRMTGEERRAIGREASEIDQANTQFMQNLVARCGWPTQSVFGKRAVSDAFLLVQHADQAPCFQAMCLPMLEQAVAAGEASASGLAYLTDRVRVKQDRPQLYGTQYQSAVDEHGVTLKNDDGSFVYLAPIVEDAANLDERRKRAGLGPWRDYEARMASLQEREALPAPRAWDGKLPVRHQRR